MVCAASLALALWSNGERSKNARNHQMAKQQQLVQCRPKQPHQPRVHDQHIHSHNRISHHPIHLQRRNVRHPALGLKLLLHLLQARYLSRRALRVTKRLGEAKDPNREEEVEPESRTCLRLIMPTIYRFPLLALLRLWLIYLRLLDIRIGLRRGSLEWNCTCEYYHCCQPDTSIATTTILQQAENHTLPCNQTAHLLDQPNMVCFRVSFDA